MAAFLSKMQTQQKELELKAFRIIAASLPQLLILMYLGGKFDLIFGLNRSDYGLTILLFMFVLTPVITLIWVVLELMCFGQFFARLFKNRSGFWLSMAMLIFIESLAIDIFLLANAKM